MTTRYYCEMCDEWFYQGGDCKACGMPLRYRVPEDPRDDAYERAAARARGNDFRDTAGKDWT